VPDVIVGAGHNGLVAACYLARAGRDVVVLEALDAPGGGARTEETIPGFRFDLHSVAHNMINMTSIPEELDLAGAGLVYQEMDPFSIAVHEDGRRVRFHRSVDATVDSIAEVDAGEAVAYGRFIDKALPIVRTVLPAVRGQVTLRDVPSRLANVVRALGTAPLATVRDVLSPYDSLLRRWLRSDLTRGPVAAFAAHAGVGPSEPGGSLFAFWQAAYHLFGQWHGRGGAQALTDALVRRLASFGGELRCSAPVARIETAADRVRAVVTESGGSRISSSARLGSRRSIPSARCSKSSIRRSAVETARTSPPRGAATPCRRSFTSPPTDSPTTPRHARATGTVSRATSTTWAI